MVNKIDKFITTYDPCMDMERLYPYALWQYCNAVTCINLQTGLYNRTAKKHTQSSSFPLNGEWINVYDYFLDKYVHTSYQAHFKDTCSMDALLRDHSNQKLDSIFHCRYQRPDTKDGWIELRILHIYSMPTPFALISERDITYEKELLEQQQLNQQYDTALRSIYDELYELNITQNTYKIIYHAKDKYVIPKEQGILSNTIGLVSDKMISPEDRERFLDFLNLEKLQQGFANGRESFMGEFRKLRQDGIYHWSSLTIFPKSKAIGESDDVYLCFIMDISSQKQIEFDTLTGINNEQSFYYHVEQLLLENSQLNYAVIRVDIDRFKFINEIYGYAEGDHLLKTLAKLLQSYCTINDSCCHINSDIFYLFKHYTSHIELTTLLERISFDLEKNGISYKPVFSYGIYLIEDRTVPIHIFCDRANLALRTVKGNRLHIWAFYDDSLRKKLLEEREIENEMEDALAQKQFCVYLQPKHNLFTGQIIGAEALVRWNHPKQGILSPACFIPLFERNGFIVNLDEYIWEETFKILRRWIDLGYPAVPISVNVSRIHIYNTDFVHKIMTLIDKYSLPTSLVELELTESAFVDNTEGLYDNMNKLKTNGISFSMDDFGSGYSSLNMLKEAPVNTIKLDREFLSDSTSTQKGQIIVQNTVLMARQLKLNVVAEGVETKLQAEFLAHSGCETAQGYYFSRPMPIENFEDLAFLKTGEPNNYEQAARHTSQLIPYTLLFPKTEASAITQTIQLQLNLIPCGIVSIYLEKNWPLYFANTTFYQKLGYKTFEDFNKCICGNVINCIYQEDRELFDKTTHDFIDNSNEYSLPFRVLKTDGSPMWINSSNVRMHLPQNRYIIICAIMEDMQKRS